MPYNRKKNIVFKILLSNLFILALGAITVWLGISSSKELYKKYQIRREINHLKQEISALDQKNSDLASFIDSFQDSKIIEREAKRRLNLKKPGEEVAVILRDKNDESQNIVMTEEGVVKDGVDPVIRLGEDSQESSNPLKWWQYITK